MSSSKYKKQHKEMFLNLIYYNPVYMVVSTCDKNATVQTVKAIKLLKIFTGFWDIQVDIQNKFKLQEFKEFQDKWEA